jgi:chemotaxis protein methyltransferase CheR
MTGGAGDALSPQDQGRFRELVRQRAGIEIPDARLIDLEKGVQAALAQSGATSPDMLYDLLAEKGPRGIAAFEAMIPAVTINETHFFRNRPQMEALEKEILPELIKARSDSKRLRIWSAACSSGEEPYSIAILLDRLLRDKPGWDVLIHGTDIDHQALQKAADALYGNWSFREVPADVKEEYFEQTDEHRYALSPRIRSMVTFSRLNLVDDPYPSVETRTDRMDLVICRNVLIYFREETIRRIVDRFHESLVEGGWLVVGHAEPSQEIFHRYAVKNFPGTITYQRMKSVAPAPAPKPVLKPIEVRQAPQPARAERKPAERKPADRTPFAPAKRDRGAKKPAPGPLAPKSVSVRKPAAAPAPPRPALATSAWNQDVAKLMQEGRADDAVKSLEESIARTPMEPRPYYELAKLHASRLRWEPAEKLIDESLELGPLAPEAHYLRGLIMQELGRVDEASEAFRRSAFLDQNFVLAHFAAAGLFARLGQTGRAQKALDTTVALLEGRPPGELVPEGDGLTVERLLDLATLQRTLVA